MGLLREECMPQRTLTKWIEISDGFKNNANFPNCIGALDGKHIRIVKLTKSGSLFMNYKKYFSIHLLAMCDSKLRFTFVDAGAYGKNCDSNVFERSVLWKKLQTNQIPQYHFQEKERESVYLFQYGITSGLWEYREELSKFLSKQYGGSVNRKDLFLTCGATHGLQLVMGAFLCPNAVIFVEDVTYMIALEAFKQYPLMKVVPVPMTVNGVDAVALQEIATREKSKGVWNVTEQRPFWAMLYTIPLFHNPTGITMSPSTCEAVVHVARSLDFVVLCEDVYNLLHYGTDFPPKRLIAYDAEGFKGGHVISNGTFSKILSPGVRVGWLEMPPRLVSSLKASGIMLSGGACNQYMSGVVTSLLQLGLQEHHLISLRATLQARMIGLCDTLQKCLPQGCTFEKPQGGYFVWVKLPEHINASDFNSWCQEKHKVAAYPGQNFSSEGKYKNYLRISIAFHNKKRVVEAVEKVCSALSTYLTLHVK